ncbi:MAG: acetate--CoA ligase family protein [Acidobacteriota bacterium]
MDAPRRSLDALFAPRSIAVVGASRRKDSIGYALLDNLITSEFNGALYPVNPKAEVVHSFKCYPSLTAIPDPVDLALIAVPKILVRAAVEEAIRKGVRGLVVITAGFSETGAAGRVEEEALRELVRGAGLRMVGPNCMGIINTDPTISMNATFAPSPARRGGIGFVSQSGALGVAILNVAADLGLGLTQFASMGNKADVSGNDLLEYWEDDPETRVICMYLESFGNPRRFTEIAKRVGRKKPILVVKSGRTAEGARAASSHTGALAGTDVTVSALLAQCGVLRANTIEELFDIARALVRCPLPAGDRVAILTNAGGPAIMATDAIVDQGLRLAELGPATLAELRSFLPVEASLANPVDMIASANEESYRRALKALLADSSVDLALVINVTPLMSDPRDVLEQVGIVAREQGKPVLAVMMATEDFYDGVKERHDLPPVYRFPESAARAAAMLHRYCAWRERPIEQAAPRFEVDDDAVARLLVRAGPDGYLEPADAFRVLEAYGIAVVPWRTASNTASALAAARELGFPVALKAVAPGLVHKTELGAVRIDLRDEATLLDALQAMQSRLAAAGLTPSGYLLQEMASGGHEVIFGVATEPRFGPFLMFGLGGKYVEVLRDIAFAVPPLSPAEARDTVRGIRGFPLLEGVRGEAGADLSVLEEVLLRLAQLVERHPTIVELDINPFLASAERAQARALDVRLRVR